MDGGEGAGGPALLVRLGLYQPEKVMYIGGSDTLPSPLTREEEGELIARLEQGDQEARSPPHRAQPASGGLHRPAV